MNKKFMMNYCKKNPCHTIYSNDKKDTYTCINNCGTSCVNARILYLKYIYSGPLYFTTAHLFILLSYIITVIQWITSCHK